MARHVSSSRGQAIPDRAPRSLHGPTLLRALLSLTLLLRSILSIRMRCFSPNSALLRWPQELQALFNDCWLLEASSRPDFEEVGMRLDSIIQILGGNTNLSSSSSVF